MVRLTSSPGEGSGRGRARSLRRFDRREGSSKREYRTVTCPIGLCETICSGSPASPIQRVISAGGRPRAPGISSRAGHRWRRRPARPRACRLGVGQPGRVAPLGEGALRQRDLHRAPVDVQVHGVADDHLGAAAGDLHAVAVGRDEVDGVVDRSARGRPAGACRRGSCAGPRTCASPPRLARASSTGTTAATGARRPGRARRWTRHRARPRACCMRTGRRAGRGRQGEAVHGGLQWRGSGNALPRWRRPARHNPRMDRYERILALHRTLQAARYPVTVARLQDELGCSRATVYRDLAFLRDALMAPVVGDGEAGFRYDPTAAVVSNCPACGSIPRNCTRCSPRSNCCRAAVAGAVLGAGAAAAAHREAARRAFHRPHLADAARARHSAPRPAHGRALFRIVCSAVLERRHSRSTTARVPPTRRRGARSRRSASPTTATTGTSTPGTRDKQACAAFSVDRIAAAPFLLEASARATSTTPSSTASSPAATASSRRTQGWATIAFSAQGRALGRRRTLAFAAAGPLPADGRYELKIPYSNARGC